MFRLSWRWLRKALGVVDSCTMCAGFATYDCSVIATYRACLSIIFVVLDVALRVDMTGRGLSADDVRYVSESSPSTVVVRGVGQ